MLFYSALLTIWYWIACHLCCLHTHTHTLMRWQHIAQPNLLLTLLVVLLREIRKSILNVLLCGYTTQICFLINWRWWYLTCGDHMCVNVVFNMFLWWLMVVVCWLIAVMYCCSPIYDAYCQKRYANGYCDDGCNNEECNWDGLDCEFEQPKVAEGMISVVLLMSMQTFRENLVAFLREVSVAKCPFVW